MTFTLNHRNAELDDLPRIVAIYNDTIAARMATVDTELVSVASLDGVERDVVILRRRAWHR